MRLFNLFGIPIKINYLMIPILLFSIYFQYFVELMIIMFIIIVHELAHSLMSVYYGVKVLEIELFPFGGIAKTDSYFEVDPIKEMVISVIGPISNYLMLFIGIIVEINLQLQTNYLYFFIITNFAIGFFNTLPILPLDGGRILRAYINSKSGFKKATLVMIKVSKFIIAFIFVIGLYFGIKMTQYFFLCGIAIFLYFKVNKEKENIGYTFIYQIIAKKKKLIEKGTMEIRYLAVIESTVLQTILQELSSNKYHFIAVMNTKGKVTGNLSESEILDALIKYNKETTLKAIIESNRK